jgi:hypothetical protein
MVKMEWAFRFQMKSFVTNLRVPFNITDGGRTVKRDAEMKWRQKNLLQIILRRSQIN